MRPTRQRVALAELLLNQQHRHVSAEQLFAEADAAGANVSLATVYNTLHQFRRAGLLREVVVEGARSYFDTNTTNHHHFYIEDEQRMVDIPESQVAFHRLPQPPQGTEVSHVDVLIRVRRRAD